jgi:hypothetical protein
MSNTNRGSLGCRHCRFYRLEGKRGGQCQMLGVHVRGVWPACVLIVPPFAPSWEAPVENPRGQLQLLQTHRHHI